MARCIVLVVISGVNLIEGGPLKVFKDAINGFLDIDIEIICLVHKKSLFVEFKNTRVKFIEFTDVKSSWAKRIVFEYISCIKISKDLRPDIWLSMHDMTPSLFQVPNQFVYCHNPSPFYGATFNDYRYDFKFALFTLFYKWLYKINIKKNKAVIMQQSWIADFFTKKIGVNHAIVAKPSVANIVIEAELYEFTPHNQKRVKFFYPALARTFKNFELILNALNYLKYQDIDIYNQIELYLTINPEGNGYEQHIYSNYKHLTHVKFLGMLSRDQVENNYRKCDVVVFPSKLETWGLPITEAKEHNKPILLVDLPYAHETLGNYHSVYFIDPNDYVKLANNLRGIVLNQQVFSESVFEESEDICYSWEELVDRIIKISSQ
jgi:glycosyltransferase involved in cell wall biosynthesis